MKKSTGSRWTTCGCSFRANQQVLHQLIARMEEASKLLNFEEAARIRDQIQAVRRVTERQFVSGDSDDLDVIGVAFDAGMACLHVLFIRQGKVLGSRSYFPKVPGGTDMSEVVQTFVGQFYLQGSRAYLRRRDPVGFQPAGKDALRSRSPSWRGARSKFKASRAVTAPVI